MVQGKNRDLDAVFPLKLTQLRFTQHVVHSMRLYMPELSPHRDVTQWYAPASAEKTDRDNEFKRWDYEYA